VVRSARDQAWRSVAPGFDGVIAMARSGLPFQIVADRQYDHSADPRRLRRALAEGRTIYLPQAHQVLPRLARLMVALRGGLLGPLREECSFLFAVEGTGRAGMGLHHDGDVDAFWLQLEGRRTVTLGPPVASGTPEDLDDALAAGGRRAGWRTLDLEPGTLFYLPPRTPHAVVCAGRSLAISLTWSAPARRGRRPSRADEARSAVEWDVASGRVDAIPPSSPDRLWAQVPALLRRGSQRELRLTVPGGEVRVPKAAAPLARRLLLMPSVSRARARAAGEGLPALLAHGLLASQDLPLRIVPDDPRALDGWRFAEREPTAT
jgi:mannose-6-phosphate isomerase-like protein (cupin superfamily)